MLCNVQKYKKISNKQYTLLINWHLHVQGHADAINSLFVFYIFGLRPLPESYSFTFWVEVMPLMWTRTR